MKILLNGKFPDQKGLVKRGKIVGWNDYGVPCREYTWIKPYLPELKGKVFEAFDDQV